MITRSLRLAALTTAALGVSATAALAAPGVTASLSPDTVSSASTATVTLSGPFPSGLPTALEVQVQKGFASSVKAVSTLCGATDAAAGTCPAAIDIGTGKVVVTVGAFGPQTVPLTLSLGAPSQPGDISSVYLYGSAAGVPFAATARLFAAGGGLELLVTKFPQLPAEYASLNPTLQSVSFTAGAKQTVTSKRVVKKRVKGRVKRTTKRVTTTYAFLTTPSTCTGSWTGSVTATYPSGPVTLPLSTPCTQ